MAVDPSTRYRIVSNFGHGDRSWVERSLTRKQLLQWFIKVQSWPIGTKFEELPDPDSGAAYYWEEDDVEEKEDWDWNDS